METREFSDSSLVNPLVISIAAVCVDPVCFGGREHTVKTETADQTIVECPSGKNSKEESIEQG